MYIFTAWDDSNPSAELDIQGEQYDCLIDVCFNYCAWFSLNENCVGTVFDLPEDAIDVQPALQSAPMQGRKKHVFSCTREARKYLLRKVNSIFSWFTWDTQNLDRQSVILPEDLCFYRNDGSIFLWSETHEGICVVCPRPEEDVSGIVSCDGWREIHYGDFFGVPFRYLEEFNLWGRHGGTKGRFSVPPDPAQLNP